MPKRLEQVRWSELSHAYGEATDTPRHLRALSSRSPKTRRGALRALSLSIIHQGSHWPGCVEATPFVIQAALSKRTGDRDALVDFLTYLATAFEFRSPWTLEKLAEREREPLWSGTYRAIERALPRLARLLDEPSPRLRAATAGLLGFFPSFHARAVPALIARLLDPGRHVAASAALSLALCALSRPDVRIEPALSALLDRSRPGSLESLAAALALCWTKAAPTDRVRDELDRAISAGRWERGFPFTERLAIMALDAMRGLPGPLRPATLRAVFEGIDAQSEDSPLAGFDRRDLVYFLVERTFPKSEPPRRPRLPEELSELELEVLRRASRETVNWHEMSERLRDRALPSSTGRLAAFLDGELPRGEWLVGRTRHWWPAWRLLVEAHLRRSPVSQIAPQLAKQLSVNELVALEYDVFLRLYDLGLDRDFLDRYVKAALRLHGRDLSAIEGGVYELLYWDRIPDDSRWCHTPLARRARFEALFSNDPAHPAMPLALHLGATRSPALEALLSRLDGRERTQLLLTSTPLPPQGARLGSHRMQQGSRWPRFHPAPWHYLAHSSDPRWVVRVLDLLARLEPWEVPFEPVVAFLAGLPARSWALVDERRTGGESLDAWIRRARWKRDRQPLAPAEVRFELRQWFRDGAWLSSHENAVILLYPCPLCAQVFRELGIHPVNLGAGARGGIEAPGRGEGGSERNSVSLSHAWRSFTVTSSELWSPSDEDPAVTEAVENALTARSGHGDARCLEIRALHRLAQEIRRMLA